jgi:hypothetical protein
MRALKRYIAAALVLSVVAGLLPAPAQAHRMFERVYDPSTGDTYRQSVEHRHRFDGTIVVLGDSDYYSSYSYPTTTYRTYGYSPYYSSSYGYSPYYSSGYYGDGYRRRSSAGPALLGAAAGFAIGRATSRRR